MKLLYITPMINGEGGVQKVLSIKTNYFIESYDYQIDILTQDNGNTNLFFEFNPKIGLFDMVLSKNKFLKNFQYRNQIEQQIKISNPDVVIVCDAGIKAFLLPVLLNSKRPLFFEYHGSKFNESRYFNPTYFNLISRKIKYTFKNICIKLFNKVILLSNESLQEWKIKNAVIIPNSLEKNSSLVSDLKSKKIIVIARHSYEKGLDRLLPIWQKINQKYPDWILEIYGNGTLTKQLINQINLLDISNTVKLFDPIKNITDKYLEASICLMTSRQEGLPMVLIEAMNHGLPIVAYNCPIGPKAIISNSENGFLIDNSNEIEFITAVCKLIEDENLRFQMGRNAKINSKKYQIEPIMEQWNKLFQRTIKPQTI